jgi:hypothetical protein
VDASLNDGKRLYNLCPTWRHQNGNDFFSYADNFLMFQWKVSTLLRFFTKLHSHFSEKNLIEVLENCRAESGQAARFAVLIPTYLAKAVELPPELITNADNAPLPLLSTK